MPLAPRCNIQLFGSLLARIDRSEAEARLLAGQSSEEVGRAVGESAATIDVYEEVFFHHRDRINDIDWVMTHLIGLDKAQLKGPDRLGAVWKLLGYFGGAEVLGRALESATARHGYR